MSQQNSLNILYIEDNIDDQLILRRILKTSVNADIKFDTAETAKEAWRKLTNNTYDLVFLDYRLPDQTGLEFLEYIREQGMTVPVIFLTGMGSEKIAVEAMRRGVEDYIIKSEIQSNEFIETIRKRLIKTQPEEKHRTDLTVLEQKALDELDHNSIDNLELLTEGGLLSYTGLEQFVQDHGIDITKAVLESLKTKGLLEEISESRLVVCPICDSSVTDQKNSMYICTNCRSPRIERVEFLSHPFCGYTGDKRTFITQDGMVCPNCKIPLKKALDSPSGMDKEGYLIVGNAFECDDCNSRLSRPEMVHHCLKCGEEFNYKNMKYMPLKTYQRL